MIVRRSVLAGLAAFASQPALAQRRRPPIPFDPDLAAIERRHGGRLGVFALDTGSRKTLAWRPDERFNMCSTFKGLLGAQVLARVDAGAESLTRRISYGQGELMPVSPVTTKHVDEGGLSVEALARAIVETSDNTAAVLLLRAMGGPESLTRFLRALGDDATRSDRTEPDCNLYDPLLDTTTPRAITMTARRILLGNVLTPRSRRLLEGWMIAATPGLNRLRAALPKGWIAGDKTGTSTARQTNDYAIVRPPGRRPLLVATYYDAPRVSAEEREQALREVGAVFVKWAS
jgi:beta-lactamase class A